MSITIKTIFDSVFSIFLAALSGIRFYQKGLKCVSFTVKLCIGLNYNDSWRINTQPRQKYISQDTRWQINYHTQIHVQQLFVEVIGVLPSACLTLTLLIFILCLY